MTATTDVVISEKSKLEFFRSDLSGTAVSRISTMRMLALRRQDHAPTRQHASGRGHEGARLARALDLGAVHDAPRLLVEGIAPVHGRAVVPQHQVADPPAVFVGELGLRRRGPYLVQQRIRFCG